MKAKTKIVELQLQNSYMKLLGFTIEKLLLRTALLKRIGN